MIVQGFALPQFPKTKRSNPSPYVMVQGTQAKPLSAVFDDVRLPVYVHYVQWRDVIVPLLQEESTRQWLGKLWKLGDVVLLLNNIIGPDGEVVFTEGTDIGTTAWTEDSVGQLFSTSEYVPLIQALILRDATAAGY
tara:strand:- start:346 stop:753 length:408 start_codon:yes stop_codon:yes gene_type:complete